MPDNAQIGKIINQVPSKPMLHSSQQISLLCLSYLFGDTTNIKPKSHSGMLLMAGRQVDYLAKRLFHVIALVRGSLDIGNTLTPKWALPRPFELNIFVSSWLDSEILSDSYCYAVLNPSDICGPHLLNRHHSHCLSPPQQLCPPAHSSCLALLKMLLPAFLS